MAIDEFTTNLPAGAEPAAAPDPSSPATFKSHEMTVSYQGPHVPTLRLQGRWLDRAGFPVGTRVRVDVSARRLIVEAIEPKESPHCADVNCPHETNSAVRRGHQPRTPRLWLSTKG
jgi:Toxin SymE, type I toxin-antitoxin system